MSTYENLNNWTPQLVKRLLELKERSWAYTWIHRENSIYLSDIYDWISVIAFSLSFFNGVILIFPNNLIYIRIFNILLSFGAGILMFYIKNKNLTETAEKHKIASSRFSNIYNNIDRQLSMNIPERENGQHYHRWITTQYDTLYGTAPDIDPPIIDEYVRKFAHKRKINPIEAAEFDNDSDSPKKNSTTTTSSSSTPRSKRSRSRLRSRSRSRSDDRLRNETESDELRETIIIKSVNSNNPSTLSNSPSQNESSEENKISSDETESESDIAIDNLNLMKEKKQDISKLRHDINNIVKKEHEEDKKMNSKKNPYIVIYDHEKKKKSKQRAIDYELKRMNKNVKSPDFSSNMSINSGVGVNSIAMTTKCLIPEFELMRHSNTIESEPQSKAQARPQTQSTSKP